MSSRPSPIRIVVPLCVAGIVSTLGMLTFPALLPTFIEEWRLTNTDAGWLNGIYYAGYLAAVPVLVSLTDRAPTRRIYYLCMVLTTLVNAGFALLAEGFWTALIFRAAAGPSVARPKAQCQSSAVSTTPAR